MRQDIARRLGDQIRDLREAREWTQQEFAKRSKLPIAFVRRIERGEVKNPSLERLGLIAAGLGVPLAELFAEHETTSDADSQKKTMLVDHLARVLRRRGLGEVRAIQVILREIFEVQRLGRR